jgi:type III secretion protein F
MSTGTLSFSGINTAVLDNVEIKEGDLKGAIDTVGPNPSTLDLLKLQQKMQEWSMLVDLQATLTKTVSETMKGIIQKSG